MTFKLIKLLHKSKRRSVQLKHKNKKIKKIIVVKWKVEKKKDEKKTLGN